MRFVIFRSVNDGHRPSGFAGSFSLMIVDITMPTMGPRLFCVLRDVRCAIFNLPSVNECHRNRAFPASSTCTNQNRLKLGSGCPSQPFVE